MARKTIRAVVDVVANLPVLLIRGGLIMRVAGRACEHHEVRRIRVTVSACCPLTLMRAGVNGEPRVVEYRA